MNVIQQIFAHMLDIFLLDSINRALFNLIRLKILKFLCQWKENTNPNQVKRILYMAVSLLSQTILISVSYKSPLDDN